jgi:hypothetical protein
MVRRNRHYSRDQREGSKYRNTKGHQRCSSPGNYSKRPTAHSGRVCKKRTGPRPANQTRRPVLDDALLRSWCRCKCTRYRLERPLYGNLNLQCCCRSQIYPVIPKTAFEDTVARLPAVLEERTDLTSVQIKTVVRRGLYGMPITRKTEVSDAELEDVVVYLTRNRKK